MHGLSAHKSAPKWSISARTPMREMKKGMPGPGQYSSHSVPVEKDKFSSSPKYSIAGGQRDAKEWGVFPGPGQYAPKHAGRELPRWGFGSEARLHEVKQNRGPGPGAYEVRGKLEGAHYSVASRPDGTSKRSNTPGPGEYKLNFNQIFESPCKPSFGASSRSELAASKTPGPGQYDHLTSLGGNCVFRSPARITITGKRNQPNTDCTPGPGPSASQFSR